MVALSDSSVIRLCSFSTRSPALIKHLDDRNLVAADVRNARFFEVGHGYSCGWGDSPLGNGG